MLGPSFPVQLLEWQDLQAIDRCNNWPPPRIGQKKENGFSGYGESKPKDWLTIIPIVLAAIAVNKINHPWPAKTEPDKMLKATCLYRWIWYRKFLSTFETCKTWTAYPPNPRMGSRTEMSSIVYLCESNPMITKLGSILKRRSIRDSLDLFKKKTVKSFWEKREA